MKQNVDYVIVSSSLSWQVYIFNIQSLILEFELFQISFRVVLIRWIRMLSSF